VEHWTAFDCYAGQLGSFDKGPWEKMTATGHVLAVSPLTVSHAVEAFGIFPLN
jgi:hypothetical protein